MLEHSGEVVAGHKVREVWPQLIVAFVMEAFGCRVLDCSVHAFGRTAGAEWPITSQLKPPLT